ncbi:MAG: peptide ligase PGM1-related protein [Actinomycetota bacterium]
MVQSIGSSRARFDLLQSRLVERLGGRSVSELESGTIVVIPSLSFPAAELRKITGIAHYEERMLFMLLWLRRPDLRVVFVTSLPIDPAIIDYYLRHLPDPEGARARLELISLDDPEPRGLSVKLLERPDALEVIARAAGDPGQSYILPFNVTPDEKAISERLGIPLYGPHPDLAFWGSKSGSRAAAAEAGVAVMDGAGELWSLRDVERAIDDLQARRPDAEAVVVKLNNGFSGQGNAIVELAARRVPLEESPVTFCAPEESWASFAPKLEREGGVVEELARDPGLASPSVQMRIAPGGRWEVVSTHDQILASPDDQVYLGCRFPAERAYRTEIQQAAERVASVLADRGVIGSFAIDFLALPSEGGFDIYLSEINLRMGGTTHPFLTARLLTQGSYDVATGELIAGGAAKAYVAMDNVRSASYTRMKPAVAIAALDDAGLAFDLATRTGASLHLMGALETYGKVGTVCIADSPEAAESLFAQVVASLDEAAES